MGAKIRTEGEPASAPMDGRFLENMQLMLSLVTDQGEMDLRFTPAGRAGGHEGWLRAATEEEVSDGVSVVVASLDDITDSKRAANRPKDLLALPYLESLRDEIHRS